MLGNPADADQPYTIRLQFPDGFRIPAHYHPIAENVTVLSGTLLLKMGTTPSDDMPAYGPGDDLHIPSEPPHFGAARGTTIIQLHGVGPFDILLAKPAASGGR